MENQNENFDILADLEIETKGIQAEETFIQILEEEFENKI
jgi:hypothetical protein